MKNKWDLSPLFRGGEDKNIEIEKIRVEKETKRLAEKWNRDKSYMRSEKKLREALDRYNKYLEESSFGLRLEYYFSLRGAEDETNNKVKARISQIMDFYNRQVNTLQFFELDLGEISARNQKKFLRAEKLKKYRHFLEKIFKEAKHNLSEPEEKIINLKRAVAYEGWRQMTSINLLKIKKKIRGKELGLVELDHLMNDGNKKVRDEAAQKFNEILEVGLPMAEAEMNAIINNKKVDDELRGFRRPDEAKHLADEVETKTVKSMLAAVGEDFKTAREYYKLKAKLMGQKQLDYHERNVSLLKGRGEDYPWEKSVKLVGEVFEDLDKEFGEIFRRFIKNNQVDVFPREGKTAGAFCAHGLRSDPVYVLLNHTNKLRDVTTLAHEFGHAINNELMKKNNLEIYYGTSTATAEVASTFMEDFVLEKIMESADEEMRLGLIMEKLNDDISSIHRQVACYRFEEELHKRIREEGFLPQEEIGQLFQKHMRSYMGPFVKQSEGSQNWWVYWGHIRRFFYNYSYASGLIISKYLQARVKKDSTFIKEVKKFLATGRDKSTEEIFRELGLNITRKSFFTGGLEEVRDLLKEAKRLAKKIKLI